jgi:UDP-2,3-diacylglucosamine pyrophosphatase LpxH
MDKSRRNIIKLSGLAAAGLAMGGCGDGTSDAGECTQGALTVTLASSEGMVAYDADRVVLKFSLPVDPQTIEDTISLHDKSGSLAGTYDVVVENTDVSSRTVSLVLREGYAFKASWKYYVSVGPGVASTAGEALSCTEELVFVTTSRSPFEAEDGALRSKIVVISDLHLNQQRAADEGYGLFTQNGALLTQFLENVKNSAAVREVIVLGDLMDMWVVPMAYDTFDSAVTDAQAYFRSVADAEVNSGIVGMLNAIADEGLIRFVYVPGNHDMLLTETIFKSIFPNGIWKGGAEGTGFYYPEAGIACEHGHNYDVFNAPDGLTTPGSILPPGYFITRIFATKNLMTATTVQSAPVQTTTHEDEYLAAWAAAVIAIDIPDLDLNEPQIVTGAGGYTQTYSVNGARDIYTSGIGPDWQQRQVDNGVYQPVLFETGLLNASGLFWYGTLEESATTQYFLPERARIAVFGHTHHAMIRKNFWTAEKIYANSGTWIDDKHVSADALGRTCVVINSSDATGSEVDVVTVYQCQEDGTLANVGEAYISV